MTGSAESSEEVWQTFQRLAAEPVVDASPSAALQRMAAEVAVRRHLFSYTDSFDSKALDRIVGHFTEDAVVTTPRGVFTGRDQIRSFYEAFMGLNRFSYHRIQSLTIRIAADGNAAAIAGYFHAPFIGEEDARSQYGRYRGQLTRLDDSWTIAEWRISIDSTRAYPNSFGQ